MVLVRDEEVEVLQGEEVSGGSQSHLKEGAMKKQAGREPGRSQIDSSLDEAVTALKKITRQAEENVFAIFG